MKKNIVLIALFCASTSLATLCNDEERAFQSNGRDLGMFGNIAASRAVKDCQCSELTSCFENINNKFNDKGESLNELFNEVLGDLYQVSKVPWKLFKSIPIYCYATPILSVNEESAISMILRKKMLSEMERFLRVEVEYRYKTLTAFGLEKTVSEWFELMKQAEESREQ